MTETVGSPITVVSPRTGEVLSLSSPLEDLGGLLLDIREHEFLLREMKNVVQQEIVKRMDFEAKGTLHAGGLKFQAPSAAPVEAWDAAELRAALLPFVDHGVISITAVDAAVEQVITWKAKKAGINALRKQGGEIEMVIDQLMRVEDRPRKVSVVRDL